jgi:ATP-dependent Clp protease ATP-binding subunit ClpA
MHMPDTISYPFTSRTYVALSIARGIAAGCGHADITPAHIALGILREGENAAVAALQFAGVGIPKLRHDLETEAAELNDPFLANEHLLLAMLRDPGTPVARIFSQYGFTYAAAMTQLQSVRTGS